MATWHLDELRAALEKRGWRISELPGDDRRISGSWEMRRSGEGRVLIVDFDGLDGSGNLLPMAESYACRVRGAEYSLYFSRRGEPKSEARERWQTELKSFVQALNQ